MARGHEGNDRVDKEDEVWVDRALEQKTELDAVLGSNPREVKSARAMLSARAIAE